MRNTYVTSSLVLLTLLLSVSVAAQTLKGDYQFQGNLDSSVAGAPALINLTGSGGPNSFVTDTIDGYTRQTLRFPFNSGLSLNITGLIPNNSYTVVALFRFDDVSGYRRVAGGDPTDDDGAYILDGRLEFEDAASVPFRQNHYIQVAITRDASGNIRAFRDGQLRVVEIDTDGDFILANVLRMFQDDTNVPTEASAGNIVRLRVFDGPLSTSQIRALDRLPNANGGGDQNILFGSARSGFTEIFTMNTDGTNHLRLTNNQANEFGPKWSPDRQKIIFYRREATLSPYRIWTMNPDGTGETQLTNTSSNDLNPSWKPDGSKIMFSRCDANFVCDLYTMNPNGSEQTVMPLLTTADDEDYGSFSPDGTKITFVCSSGGTSFANQNICTANADGSGRLQRTNTLSPVANSWPVFSPDSQKIAFARYSDSLSILTTEIFTMNADGSLQTQLTTNSFSDYGPVWSPDGQRLAFSSEREAAYVEVYTMNASDGGSVTRLTTSSMPDTVTDWYRPSSLLRTPFDYDGDGMTDVSVFRSSSGSWYILNSSNNSFRAEAFGTNGDKIVPADYDGDRKTDIAVWRPSTGFWYIIDSSNGTFRSTPFGQSGDIPAPGDYDGDGKADICVYRQSVGTFYLLRSSNGSFQFMQWGQAGDVPVVSDFDGDGKADFSIYRDSISTFYYLRSSDGGVRGQQWGLSGDKPIAGDFDGDNHGDIAVYRPSAGAWYVLKSSDNGFFGVHWGTTGDIPASGDYDGDRKMDVAVFRSSSGTFYILRSSNGTLKAEQFGTSGDVPAPSAYVP